MNVKFDLSIYATKADLKIAAVADTSKFAKKIDLCKLKIDKLDIEKLEPAPVDLSNLSDVVVTNEVVKKSINDKLVEKVYSDYWN